MCHNYFRQFLFYYDILYTENSIEKVAYVANHSSSFVTVIDIEKTVSDPENAVITTAFIPNSQEPTWIAM
jgi:hypothetical protein